MLQIPTSTNTGLHTLMDRYIDGDERAFAALHTQLLPRIRARVARMIRDPALIEDLTQQAFLRAHQARHRFESAGGSADRAVEAWYLAIARNAALDYLRQQYRRDRRHETLAARGQVEGMGVPEALPTPEELEAERERSDVTRKRVQAAIEQLPPGQAEVVRLHKLSGLSMAEISERLRVRPGALRVRAHRAYRALADLLGVETQPQIQPQI